MVERNHYNQDMVNIAIIPARGGSKRIPRKNIKLFNGKPMIAWSIDVAQRSGLFEHIVVSTDDNEISDIAKSFGAEVPFCRPADLADDLSPTVPVIAHAINECKKLGLDAENICCIYPCAPFIRVLDLIKCLDLLNMSEISYVYPVTEYAHPVQRAMLRSEQGSMRFLSPEYELQRTQDLEKTYHDVGQFYWGRSSAWTALRRMHSEALGFVIPHWRVVDIDTEQDWERAELLYKILLKN